MNGNDGASEFIHTLESPCDGAERITELMDAPTELDLTTHALSRGTNPYLDRCMYCNCPRSSSQDGEDGLELLDLQLADNNVINSFTDSRSFSSLKLEIWTCPACRKAAGGFQSFLESNFPQASDDLPFLCDKTYIDPLSCARYQEECDSLEKEATELHENWIELHTLVQNLYSSEEQDLAQGQGERLKYLVDKLCSQDPHQLFLRLESQIRDIMVEVKTSLLVRLKENGIATPELALDFTRTLLSHYDLLTKKAHLFAQYLGDLTEHLQRFKVTWELLNKHLFHSIAHSDPVISSHGPSILEQLRHGSAQTERLKDDPFCSVRKHLLKFQEEMSEVIIVWRDCQQLIETYCQEEVKNTQKQVSIKARNFVSHQRQLLKKQLMKEPLMHEALSETMRNLMSGHKSSAERVLCHNCMRERCTCDECTITHMITCGIIDGDKGEMPPLPSSFSFALDHAHNVMNITPSASSSTSSSGSGSPVNIEDKLSTFYECERVLKEELGDALLRCDLKEVEAAGLNGDSNSHDTCGAVADDEEDDDEDDDDNLPSNHGMGDEPHSLQIPICDLKDADALWEAAQQHHHEQLLQQQQIIMGSQHSCSHCKQAKHGRQCPFQARTEPGLAQQVDVEVAKSNLLSGEPGDHERDAVTNVGGEAGDRGSGDGGGGGVVSPGVCATCQCHACLKQSGHVISASLPLQIPVSSPPAELHLYPHIHGLPQQHQQHYLLDLPPPLLPPMKFPVQLDFDEHSRLQDHLTYAYSDWENVMQSRPGSLAGQHHHQHHHRLSTINSDLLPPSSLVTSPSPFTFDLASHLATHTMHTSTTNTGVFKSVAGKPLASTVLPTLNSMSQMASEGSSVDPSKPLDFTSHSKPSHSCVNLNSSVLSSSFSSHSCSCPPFMPAPSSSVPGVPVLSEASPSLGSCSGPSCSRPTPLGGNVSTGKWERSQHCRKFNANKSLAGIQDQHTQHTIGAPPLTGSLQGPSIPTSSAVLKNMNFTPKLNIQSCSHPPPSKPAVLPPNPVPADPTITTTTITSVPTTQGPIVSLPCSNSSPTMVNNISVGTSTPCNDPECDAHQHDENCDSIDDSCSEKSSSTSTSNQKEGKYCDCCYCEFFGHNNTQVAKISTNYIEMKDRLRKKLKKRQSESRNKLEAPKNGFIQEASKSELDLLEKKGLDGLLSFINGTDKDSQGKGRDKDVTAKAAKRARQKQKKLEEKARQVKCTSPTDIHSHPELCTSLEQLIFKQTSNLGIEPRSDSKQTMAKCESKKAQPVPWTKNVVNDLKDISSSVSRQEISRSSLIIESTRPTISVSAANLNRCAPLQQKVDGGSSESPQDMVQFLNSLQQQQNKQKPASPSSVTNSKNNQATKTTGKQMANTAAVKVESDATKTNGVAKVQQNHCDQPQQQLQQQQKQKQPASAMNGKVAPSCQPMVSSNHITSNGISNGFSKCSQHGPHVHANGKLSKDAAVSARPSTPVKSVPTNSDVCKNSAADDGPSAGRGNLLPRSPSSGSKATTDQVKTNGKSKKNKKKNRNGHVTGVDEIFMPKSQSELDGDVDDFERELEEFKRFCFEPAEPKERRKIAVNVNLKDIFKKKTNMV